MSLSIIESCVSCWACEPVCPNDAISKGNAHFTIDPKKCTECEEAFADPQCATICPIEGAIRTAANEAFNPEGSLTGIPPEKMAAAMAEIQAR